MTTRLKEKIASFDSKKESQITRCMVAFAFVMVFIIIILAKTNQLILCNITQVIAIGVLAIWLAIISIREKRKDVIMRNKMTYLILSNKDAVFWYSYIIVMIVINKIVNPWITKLNPEITIIVVGIFIAIIILGVLEIFALEMSEYFNKKLK